MNYGTGTAHIDEREEQEREREIEAERTDEAASPYRLLLDQYAYRQSVTEEIEGKFSILRLTFFS